MQRLRVIPSSVFAVLVALGAVGASAQPFPNKPVRLISLAPPGGGLDIVSRLLAPKLTEAMGQTFIVENKPGASGTIAAEYVARSPADGHTILAATNILVTNAAMPQKLPFDVIADFEPIAMVASIAVALAVNPSIKTNSVQGLIELVRSQPGKWSYSSCGTGTAMHLAGELFKQFTKLDMTHVPYKGCGPALADGVAGHVPVLFNNLAGELTLAKAGKLRILAVAMPTRSLLDPSIPSFAEAGLSGFDASIWIGFLAPTGTPRDILQKLNAEFTKAANEPDTRDKLRTQFIDHRSTSRDQFREIIRTDIARWSAVIKEANIRPDL